MRISGDMTVSTYESDSGESGNGDTCVGIALNNASGTAMIPVIVKVQIVVLVSTTPVTLDQPVVMQLGMNMEQIVVL